MQTIRQSYRRRPWGFVLLLFLACLIFCAAPAVDAAALKVELVNKTEEGECILYYTGQVQLTYPDGRTQLLPYRSHLQPVAADGKVYIFTTKGPKITRIVVYDSTKRKEKSCPVPEDFKFPYFGQPSFSPDGTKVAYYFFSGESLSKPKFSLVDRMGKKVKEPKVSGKSDFTPEPGEPPEVLVLLWGGQKAGFKDLTGKVVIPPQFDEARDFSEGLAPIRINRKWGYIDSKGKTVIPSKYYRARGFSEGLAAVNIGGKWDYGK
jgi:hypothetical protein